MTRTASFYEEWSGTTAYLGGDITTQTGVAYLCILAHTNHVPPNPTYWLPLAGSSAVSSVFTRTGAVVAASGDYSGAQVSNTPAGGIAATDVQAAVNELDTEKAPLASPTFTGTVTVPAPSNGTDAATKAYVDATAQGLSIKASCRLATAAALPAVTLVGSTLVAVGVGVLTIDGQAVALNDRILVKDQVAGAQNGIYTCTTAGASLVAFILTRATDSDTSAEIVGGFTFIEEGTVNAAAGFVNTNSGTITIGTTAITYTQFSGAGEIIAGAALTKTGNTLDVAVDGSSIEVSADALRVKAGGITAAMLATGVLPANLSRSARSSNTILAAADKGTVICATAAYTQTLTAAATLGAGWWVIVKNDTADGTTVLTLDPNSSETIDGLTTATMYSGETRLIECDGANFTSQLLEGGYAKFTPSGGTFVVPAGVMGARAVCVGSGGQGGGGASANTTLGSGGGGGGGGAVADVGLTAASLGAAGTSITVTVGAGGSAQGGGGTARGASAGVNAGTNGSNGAATSFGTLVKAGGGGGGVAGSGSNTTGGGGGSLANTAATSTAGAPATAAGSGGIAGQGGTSSAGQNDGVCTEWGGASGGSSGASGNSARAGGSSIYGGPGGGGGNSVSAANGTRAASATNAGGINQSYTVGGGAIGTATPVLRCRRRWWRVGEPRHHRRDRRHRGRRRRRRRKHRRNLCGERRRRSRWRTRRVQGVVLVSPVYLIVSQTPSGQDIRPVVATDLADAAAQIKAVLGAGLSINNGVREPIQLGLIRLNAAGTLTPNADGTQAVIQTVNDTQAAIADLPAFTVTTIAQANTALQAVRTTVNTLLAEMRLAGVIAP